MPKTAIPLLFVSGLLLATASKVDADVVYTVLNPANNFTLFVYDSPTFITTDTMVGVAQLAFANPLNHRRRFHSLFFDVPGNFRSGSSPSGCAGSVPILPAGYVHAFRCHPGRQQQFRLSQLGAECRPGSRALVDSSVGGWLAWPIRSAPQVQEKAVGSPEGADQRQ